jgi:hypothetical protein
VLRVRMAHHGRAMQVAFGGDDRANQVTRRAGDRAPLGAQIHVHQRDSVADIGCQQQALDDSAANKMRLDDFVDITLVDEVIPNGFGIDHDHRPTGTAVEAPGPVDTHTARAIDAGRFDARFAAVKPGLRVMLSAAGFAVFTLVEAEENVAPVITRTHAAIVGGG